MLTSWQQFIIAINLIQLSFDFDITNERMIHTKFKTTQKMATYLSISKKETIFSCFLKFSKTKLSHLISHLLVLYAPFSVSPVPYAVWFQQFRLIYFTCHYSINFISYLNSNVQFGEVGKQTTTQPSPPLCAMPFACLLLLFREKTNIQIDSSDGGGGSSSSQASWWIDLLNQINRNIYFANNSTKLWP